MTTLPAPSQLPSLSDSEFARLLAEATRLQAEDRQRWQILYYQPTSPRAMLLHESRARLIGAGGGNRSGKSTSGLVELIARVTGVFPRCIAHTAKWKFRGPTKARVVVESLTGTLETAILPKLRWNKWNGASMLDQSRGHWGWVPQDCLIDGDWDESYLTRLRQLTVLCRDPDDLGKVLGESTIQFMSYDQSAADFASDEFSIILLDEPPPEAIFRENQARTMSVGGTLMLTMTWPDDPTTPVDYIYDEVYEPGQPGPDKDPNVDWLELHTEDNAHIDQKAVAETKAKWSATMQQVRMYGRPMRFANRVHAGFTKRDDFWCFKCGNGGFQPMTVGDDPKPLCPSCGSDDIDSYCHVREFDANPAWPVIRLLDPHPRKPNHFLWCQVDPADDVWVVQEAMLQMGPVECKLRCDEIERALRMRVAVGLVDPNMGASPSSAKDRSLTWQQEFRDAGLDHELANDSDVGRSRVDDFLRPNPSSRQPRLHFHPRCKTAILHMERFTWDEHKRNREADQKQTAKKKYDDFPALLRYLMNYQPTFKLLHYGAPTIRREGRRKGY